MTRRLVAVLPALALAAAAAASRGSAQPVVRGYAVAPDVTVRLYIPAGTLRIEAWERDSIHFAGTLGANAAVFGGGARTHVKLGVEARSHTDSTIPAAQVVVQVPRRARLWVKMIDGDLAVSGTTVELEAYTVRGRVDVHDVAGSTTVESIDAPVTLTDAIGDVRVRGSRAPVTLERVRAALSVSTVSGGVTLRASGVDGRIETVGGTIDVGGVRAGGVLELQSHSGTIVLRLDPRGVPALDLSSRRGTTPQPRLRGDARYGRIAARSFRGDVRVELTTRRQRSR
jgi:hypothetical protein